MERNASVSPYIRKILRGRERLPQDCQHGLRHGAPGIGDVAQIGKRLLLQRRVGLRQQAPECRHACQAGDALLQKRLNNFARKNEIDQDDGSALLECGHQLVHAGIEAERQDGQNALGSVISR